MHRQIIDEQGPGSLESPGRPSLAYENGLIALFALTASLTFLNRAGIAFMFPQIKAALHLSHAQLGALMAATAVTWGISSIAFSLLSDMLGGRPKLIIIICVLGFSAIGAMAGSVSTFTGLLLLRGAMGLFEGPVIPLIQSAIAKSSSPHRLGANLGLTIGGSGLVGALLSPVLMVSLVEAVGWRQSFHFVAIPGVPLAIALWLLMRPDVDAGIGAGTEDRPRLRDVLGLFSHRNNALALLGAMAVIGIAVTLATFLPLFISESRTIPAAWQVAVMTISGAAGAIGGIIVPALSDRIGRKPCLLVATFCLAITPIGLVLSDINVGFLGLAALASFISGGAMTLMVFIIPSETVPPKLAATTFALLLFGGEMVGGASVPPLAGFLADRFSLPAALWFCAALGGVTFAASLAVQEPRRRPIGRPAEAR